MLLCARGIFLSLSFFIINREFKRLDKFSHVAARAAHAPATQSCRRFRLAAEGARGERANSAPLSSAAAAAEEEEAEEEVQSRGGTLDNRTNLPEDRKVEGEPLLFLSFPTVYLSKSDARGGEVEEGDSRDFPRSSAE